jgi:hypothetical protein
VVLPGSLRLRLGCCKVCFLLAAPGCQLLRPVLQRAVACCDSPPAHQAAALCADDGVVLCLGVVHESSRRAAPAVALSISCVQVHISAGGLHNTSRRQQKQQGF